MKVGSKGRYAVAALVDVTRNAGGRSVSLAEVAGRQGISLSYLEQLFAMLRRAELVISARGPGGGYRLARPSDQISIRAVFDAVAEGDAADGTDETGSMLAAPLWRELNLQVQRFLESVSLADVISGRFAVRGDAAGLDGGHTLQLS